MISYIVPNMIPYLFLQQIQKVIWRDLLQRLGIPLDYITDYNFDEVSSDCNAIQF